MRRPCSRPTASRRTSRRPPDRLQAPFFCPRRTLTVRFGFLPQIGAIMLIALWAATPSAARNYLIVIADDLGVDKVDGYSADYATTVPHVARMDTVDSLADAGVRFTRAWATPLCVPTRTSLQTGLYPMRHGQGAGVAPDEPGVDPDVWPMLGTLFSDAGFTTGFFGKWQIGNEDEEGVSGFPAVTPIAAMPHPGRSGYGDFDG